MHAKVPHGHARHVLRVVTPGVGRIHLGREAGGAASAHHPGFLFVARHARAGRQPSHAAHR